MKYVLILCIFLIACAPTDSPSAPSQKENVDDDTEEMKEYVPPSIINCTDTDGGNEPSIRGKAQLVYDNGQKESLNDRCLIEEETPFNQTTFQEEYLCDGLEPFTKINICDGICDKGMCP